MTLIALVEQVAAQGGIPTRRLKDVKTSIRYLAQALGRPGPEYCHEADYRVPDWKDLLNRYLSSLGPTISGHTVRNTRNNLSTLFRQAEAFQLVAPLDRLPARTAPLMEKRREMRATSPYLERSQRTRRRYSLHIDRWPAAIRRPWEEYCRRRHFQMRPISIRSRTRQLEQYLGYFATVDRHRLQTWEALFDVHRLDRFIRWQTSRNGVRMTTQGHQLAILLKQLAHVSNHPNADALRTYCRELPRPEPMHNKQHHWIMLRELEQVALSLTDEASKPVTTPPNKRQGAKRALYYQRALILRLLVRIPLRQRNVREMLLGRNLYQDERQHWNLTFQGAELKVSHRDGKINSIEINLSQDFPELIPQLETFLQNHRPKLLKGGLYQQVFLSQRGRPFTEFSVRDQLKTIVYAYTGKRFYPHLIRTIWATQYIAATGDFTTAAHMLNDRVDTVIKRYQEILGRDHVRKARAFLANILQ